MNEKAQNKKLAATYLRRSTDRQEQSIGDQRAEIKRHAKEHGFKIIREYVDDAISGTSTSKRKGFQKMIEDAQKPGCPFRFVLTYDIKRFSRGDCDEAGYYRHLLKQHGIGVIYTTEPLSGNDTDDIVRQVKQWLARQDSKDLSKNTIRGQVSTAEDGFWNGGTPPFGYDSIYCDSNGKPYMVVRFLETREKQIFSTDGRELRKLPPGERISKSKKEKVGLIFSSPERVGLVRRIFDMSVRGGFGYKKIAEQLNIEGVSPPRDGAWSRKKGSGWSLATVRSILMNPIYTGCMVWNRRQGGKFHSIAGGRAKERKGVHSNTLIWNDKNDWVIVPDTHPAIIDTRTFQEAQKLRQMRSVKRNGEPYLAGRAKYSPYLLTSLISCTRCGHRFHGYTVNSLKRRKSGEKIKTFYYACGGAVSKGKAVCERKLVCKDELEADILNRIKIQVERFLSDGGDKLLKKYLEEELRADYRDPKVERQALKKKLQENARAIDRLLDSLTPVNKEFVDKKLIALKRERDELNAELEAFDALPNQSVNIGALVDEIIKNLGTFEDIFNEGTLEEKKQFIRLFVEKIELDTEEKRALLYIRKFPAPSSLATGNSSFKMVAGVGFEPTTFGL